jgi:hypothetical protein
MPIQGGMNQKAKLTFKIEEFPPTGNKKDEQDRIKTKDREFESIAERAFMTIRQHSDILINILILMLVSGMEELNMKGIRFI